jgi:hypothetical protein
MKKTVIASLIVVMALGVGVTFAQTGNGAPSGAHFTLNIIGVKAGHEKYMDDCDSGNRIFVKLGQAANEKKGLSAQVAETDIWLTKGDFAVLDCDGTDGDAAFQLQDPYSSNAGCTAYSVWARALGKPGGQANMTLCVTYTDDLTGEEIDLCSPDIVNLPRSKGGVAKFTNVSLELLTICVQVCTAVDADGNCITWEWERKYLFDEDLSDQFWKYDNEGLKHAQLRFYYEEDCSRAGEWGCP